MRKPYDREHYVPTPSPRTIFFRTFVPWQLIRFIYINLKMVRMIWIGNHGKLPARKISLPEPAEAHGPAA
jgi:hypothetical protein